MAGRAEQWAETAVGALVLVAAGGFLVYALGHTSSVGRARGGYELIARFGDVGSLATGADVRVAGVKVGSVSSVELDPKTYLAKTRLQIQSDVKLPTDSVVKITPDGLLGGEHLTVAPGGGADDLKPGGEFQNVQGAVDLFGLIGQVIRPQGAPSAGASPNSSTGAPPPPAADPYPGAH